MFTERELVNLVRTCQRADARGSEATRSERDRASEAWAALYRHFHPRIVGFCRRTLRGGSAEDLAADILLRARFRIETFDSARKFSPWLFRVAANRCWDEVRRRNRSEPLDDRADLLQSAAPDPLESLLTRDARARVRRAVEQLPLRQRFALSLRYSADFSYQEIADTLGVTRTNVGVLLLRGRRRLRRLLAETEV